MDQASRHQEGRINAAVGARATNVVVIRAMGVVEVDTTSKTAGTRTRTNSTVHPHVGGVTINPQTHRDVALELKSKQKVLLLH